ncbi:MAG TPA: hypothetical protein VM120_17665, partial [Bryobacteraceae bacterium]|nr:hypothetical protein [Bryobacteraceae bacterium]
WVYLTPGIEFGALFNQFGGSVSWFACHAPKLRSCKLENQATLPKAHCDLEMCALGKSGCVLSEAAKGYEPVPSSLRLAFAGFAVFPGTPGGQRESCEG